MIIQVRIGTWRVFFTIKSNNKCYNIFLKEKRFVREDSPNMRKKLLFIIVFAGVILSILFLNTWKDNSHKINLNREIKTTIFNQYKEEQLLVFFGYVGCVDVCTPRLEELNEIYTQVDSNKTAVVFINLSKVYDEDLPLLFVHHFNKNFYAPHLDKNILDEIKSEFNIYFAQSFRSSEDYDHTSFVYLLKREKDGFKLKSIYIATPLQKKAIVADLKGIK